MYFFSEIRDFLLEPNMIISNIITIPIIFIGMYINLLVFKNLLNLEATKKQSLQYIFFSGAWIIFCNAFISAPFGLYIKCIILPRNSYVHI